MARKRESREKPPKAEAVPPAICGFACPFADFPPPETAGICRTMAAVHCRKLHKLVDKNLPCRAKKGR